MTSSVAAGKDQRALRAVALAAAYLAASVLSLRYTRFEGGVAFIWAAGPLLLGALIVSDKRRWPELIATCCVASFIATWVFGLGPRAAAPLAVVNMGEAVLGAWLLRRLCRSCADLKSMSEIAILLLSSGIVAPAVGAFFGAAVAANTADVAYWPNWLTWYAGHALGAVALVPIVLLTLRGDLAKWMRQAPVAQRIEAFALLSALAAVTAAVFAQTRFPLLFLPFLPMMFTVFRIGRLGAAASLTVLAVIGCVFTVRGSGPVALILGSIGLRAQFFQLYLATATLIALPAAGDLKRRKRTLQDLEHQATLFRLILDRTGDVIMTLGLSGRIRFASPSSLRVLGLTPEKLVGTMPQALIHPDDVAAVEDVHRTVLAEPDRTFTVEYRVVVEGRERGWFETHARAALDSDGKPNGAVVIIRDVSPRKDAERLLTTAALTDQLTGIANRRAFEEALTSRLGRGTSFGPAVLALFDLDRFKSINDLHGHAAGDKVLCAFAEVLRNGVRGGDLVARLGGEEFVAIIEGDLDAGRSVCDRLRAKLAGLDVLLDDETSVSVTVSVGMAALPPNGSGAAVLAAADAALYRAKAEGRNRVALASGEPLGPLAAAPKRA